MEDILEERRSKGDILWILQDCDTQEGFSPKLLDLSLLDCIKKSSCVTDQLIQMKPAARKEANKKIDEIYLEMNHAFNVNSIRQVGFSLAKIFKQLYDHINVDVEGIEKIGRLPSGVPVLYLPTHRSYVDFLLVSFICFHYQLPLPVIAAGMDFKSMMWVGELLRSCGAFFIRRRLAGDRLYSAVLRAYVQSLALTCPQPTEFFIEGTRSRSGKPLPPRTGLLAYYLELLEAGRVPDLYIVPIAISYDRVLEENLYAYEMLGTPKPPESTGRLVRAVSVLAEHYGSVHVRVGDVFSARDCTAAQARPLALRVLHSQVDAARLGAGTLLLAALQLQGWRAPLQTLVDEAAYIRRRLQEARPSLLLEAVDSAAARRALHVHHRLVCLVSGEVELRAVAAAAASPSPSRLRPETLRVVVPRLVVQLYVNPLLVQLVSPTMAVLAAEHGVQDRLSELLALLAVEFPSAEPVAPPAADGALGERRWRDMCAALLLPYLHAYLLVIQIVMEGLPGEMTPPDVQREAERRCTLSDPASHLCLCLQIINNCTSALQRVGAGQRASSGTVTWNQQRLSELRDLLSAICKPSAKL